MIRRARLVIERWREAERATRPMTDSSRSALARRWRTLPHSVRTDAQTLGRIAVGCEGTHGVFPRCNFACTPCYHSADANRVRVDGAHTIAQVEAQMALLSAVRGPHAHAQLIGGEVSLLDPDDHAATLSVMRRYGREPMSFTHGDLDYDHLERLVLGPDGRRRLSRVSFAGHFDTTMRGRRGLRRPRSEADLTPFRKAFCDHFVRLRAEHGVRAYLAHNMTVVPDNLDQIPEVVRSCRSMGFNMMSFQPAAGIGARQQDGASRSLDPDEVWASIEAGVGAPLSFRAVQTGDERCNRMALGAFVDDRWVPLLDEDDERDLAARDAFYRHLGGIRWTAAPPNLAAQLMRVAVRRPSLIADSGRWLARRLRSAGGPVTVLRAAARHRLQTMTFVMHRFMHAEDVGPAWELLQRGERSADERIAETQDRLQACFYSMAHPETGEIVPACVQHAVLDPEENVVLSQLLPLPRSRTPPDRSSSCAPGDPPG